MAEFQLQDTVGEIVTRRPHLSRVFELAGVDYCCGGKKTLEEACQKKSLDPQEFLKTLEEAASKQAAEPDVDFASMPLTELADLIERTHHAYLREELSRLDFMTRKVAGVHGEADPRLLQIRKVFVELVEELSSHMLKEERILFPMVRELEASATAPEFHCGSLANPIRQMEDEHDAAGGGLEKLRELSDDYSPPEWACNTYRAMLDALAALESDMHLHVHKENNILFPRALQMEAAKKAK